MLYNANALVTDPATGEVKVLYWSLRHNGRQRTGTVNIAPVPPFPDEAATIQAAKTALGAAFITALEDELDTDPPPVVDLPTPTPPPPPPPPPPQP